MEGSSYYYRDSPPRFGISDSQISDLDFGDDFFVGAADDSDRDVSNFDDSFVIPFARKALEYFNSKECLNFELVIDESFDFGINVLPKSILHINFYAQPRSGASSSLFYAELETTSLTPEDDYDCEINILGCAMIRLIDSGNPLGFCCNICDSETLIHPGPLRGYCVEKGDLFKNSIFWKYRPTCNSIFNETFTANKNLYLSCARKAVDHLNSKVEGGMDEVCVQFSLQFRQMSSLPDDTLFDAKLNSVSNWKLSKLLGGMDRSGDPIHVNFTVESDEIGFPVLCFAELFLPEAMIYKNWTEEKESFLQVRGCCIMKNVYFKSAFGRLCGVCHDRIVHPGPAYGYTSVVGVGEDFTRSEFMQHGSGIF